MRKLLAFLAMVLIAPAALCATFVNWDASAKNTDGSPLTDLAGYKVYHGLASKTYDANPVQVAAATLKYIYPTTPGTHYYAISAFNAAGAESAKSAEVQVVISPPVTCPANESRSQTCVAPLIGNWTQTQTYGPEPACTPSGWLPAQAPDGMCVAPALLTAGPLSYMPSGTTMTAVGLVVAGLPCGPDIKVVASVKYCRIVRAQTDFVNWPADLKAVDIWARAQ